MKYLVWSFEHRQWWGPGHCGYTNRVTSAGRYTAAEAIEIMCNDVVRRNMPVREEGARDGEWPTNAEPE